jgi:hypothetical protein
MARGAYRGLDFIRIVTRQSDLQMNIHWKPQTACLLSDVVSYDFVGRVEPFDDDIRIVLARIGADPALYEPHLITNRSPSNYGDAVFTDGMAELVFNRYRPDFERFGYPRDSYGRGRPIG